MNARKIDRAQVTPNRAMAQWFEEDVLFQQMAQGDDIELLADFFELDALRRRGRESRRQRGWGHPYNGGSLRHHCGGRLALARRGIRKSDCPCLNQASRPTNWDVDEKNWATGRR